MSIIHRIGHRRLNYPALIRTNERRRGRPKASVGVALVLAAYLACVGKYSTTTTSRAFPPDESRDGGLAAALPEDANDERKHWRFRLLDGGDRVDCRIHVAPDGRRESERSSSSSKGASGEGPASLGREDRYAIHVHGLHHTGTGYLRKTLHDALNDEFAPAGAGGSENSPPAASVHDSMRPYRNLIDEAGGNLTKIYDLHRKYHVPEDEGQHLQSIYPKFAERTKAMKAAREAGSNVPLHNAGKLVYLADLCAIVDGADGSSPATEKEDVVRLEKRVGDLLFRQWSPYWDPSATFLLQKTPTMDVSFLERTKVLPTLHVIVARHPMTGNSWGFPQMSSPWANAWTHVLETLARDEVEWYAVVTYEALVEYHGEVVRDLLEVVKSGVDRHRSGGRRRPREDATSDVGGARSGTVDFGGEDGGTNPDRPRRRLEYHTEALNRVPGRPGKRPPTSYLKPKAKNLAKWERCLKLPHCRNVLKRLTSEVLPRFGYASLNEERSDRAGLRANSPLSSSPGPVTVTKEFGRVLFSSEGAALNELRKSRGGGAAAEAVYIEYKPDVGLVSSLRDLISRK